MHRTSAIGLLVVAVIIVVATSTSTTSAQYPCCYEPPYLVHTHYIDGPNGELYVWDEYSDGHWVGVCYGCGYGYGGYGYDFGGEDGQLAQDVAYVIDEGGYYDVLAYGRWVFSHDVHGSHHCCAATLTDDPVISEDVAQEWTQGPYIVQFVFVDGVRWEQWYDPYYEVGWWEAHPGPGIDPYCHGCG